MTVFSLQAVLDEEYDDIVGFNVWHGGTNANNAQYDTWKNVTIYVSARHDWETGIVCASGVTLPPTTSYAVNAIPRFVQCASMLAGTKVVTIMRFFPTGGSLAITELQAMRIGGESCFLPSSARAASVRVLSACACTCTHVGTLPTTQNDYAWALQWYGLCSHDTSYQRQQATWRGWVRPCALLRMALCATCLPACRSLFVRALQGTMPHCCHSHCCYLVPGQARGSCDKPCRWFAVLQRKCPYRWYRHGNHCHFP